MRPCEEAIAGATEALKAHGIQNYVLILKDPDSFEFKLKFSGDGLWCVGAADAVKDFIKSETCIWKKEPPKF